MLAAVTNYVRQVGNKLAAVADRKLPYEFVVINSSELNAWALPGGKLAINRGLLVELKNEAELAAVLGHEIVHAAARHGAQQMEQGQLLQIGAAIASIGAAAYGGSALGEMVGQGSMLGAQLVSAKFGRDDELEADLYGMRYMKAAGYDLQAAVALQELFVRKFSSGQEQDWMTGLFASHPPSPERVEANKRTMAELGGPGGDLGADRYRAGIANLLKDAPAYAKYDQAVDSESAYEILQKRVRAGAADAAAAGPGAPGEGTATGGLGGVLAGIGGLLGGIFGTSRPRGTRLSTGQVIAREITRSVTNRMAGQVAANIGRSIGGKMGSSVGRAIVRGTLGGMLRR